LVEGEQIRFVGEVREGGDGHQAAHALGPVDGQAECVGRAHRVAHHHQRRQAQLLRQRGSIGGECARPVVAG
jgi:hypothetical protein